MAELREGEILGQATWIEFTNWNGELEIREMVPVLDEDLHVLYWIDPSEEEK